MSDLICTNVESLNIQVQVIDQAIIDLKSVIDNLSGENGVKLIAAAGRLVDENLSGEFEEAITHVSKERELYYKDAIFNLEVMVLVLKVYREYLRNGPNGKLVENKQHIEMAPKDMDKQILDLEFSISDIKPKLFSTDYVDGYVRSRRSYLESEIRRKESHQPEPLDTSRERHLLSVLNHNEKEHGVAINNIENGISAVTALNSEIEEEIGVLKKEFDDYYKLWDVYENKDVKLVTYNNINYSLDDIAGISLSGKTLEEEDIYARFRDGIDSIDEYNDLLNLKNEGDEEALSIFNDHLISDEEALNKLKGLVDEMSKTDEWKNLTDEQRADWIITLIAGSWYYNGGQGEIFWSGTINNDYYNIPEDVWNNYSIEIVELYHWIRDNANEEVNGGNLIDVPHLCATLETYIGDPSFFANNIESFLWGGEIYEGAGWLGDYKTDGENASSRDITTDYVALKAAQIYNNQDEKDIPKAIEESYNSLNGNQISSWEEFDDIVIGEGIYTQEELDNLKG